jgi:hypothetical protein
MWGTGGDGGGGVVGEAKRNNLSVETPRCSVATRKNMCKGSGIKYILDDREKKM